MSSPQINMMNKIKVRSIILLSILLLNQHYAKCNRSQNKNLNNLFSTPAKENYIEKTSTRNQKMIPIFQVIRFPVRTMNTWLLFSISNYHFNWISTENNSSIFQFWIYILEWWMYRRIQKWNMLYNVSWILFYLILV